MSRFVFAIIKRKNYCSEALINGKFDATLCNSMDEYANLTASQACVIYRHLSCNFGNNVIAPERVRRITGFTNEKCNLSHLSKLQKKNALIANLIFCCCII